MRSVPGMETVAAILDSLGVPAVAAARKLPYSTVASWKARGKIPSEEFAGIAELAREKGLPEIDEVLLAKVHARAAPLGVSQ